MAACQDAPCPGGGGGGAGRVLFVSSGNGGKGNYGGGAGWTGFFGGTRGGNGGFGRRAVVQGRMAPSVAVIPATVDLTVAMPTR